GAGTTGGRSRGWRLGRRGTGSCEPAEDLVDDVVDRTSGRVDHDGVVGNRERRCGTGGVDAIAQGDVGGRVVVGQVAHLLVTPAGPLLLARREIHLELGLGKHNRADVTALDHSPAV